MEFLQNHRKTPIFYVMCIHLVTPQHTYPFFDGCDRKKTVRLVFERSLENEQAGNMWRSRFSKAAQMKNGSESGRRQEGDRPNLKVK